MTQRLRTLVLVEGSSSVPSTRWWLATIHNSSPRQLTSMGTRHGAYTYIYAGKHVSVPVPVPLPACVRCVCPQWLAEGTEHHIPWSWPSRSVMSQLAWVLATEGN